MPQQGHDGGIARRRFTRRRFVRNTILERARSRELNPGRKYEDRSAGSDVLERLLARLYYRFGARMVVASLVACVVFGALASVVFAGWAVRFLSYSSDDFVLLLGLGLPVLCIAGAVWLWSLRGPLAGVLAWSGEHRTPARAPVVWRAAIGLPRAAGVRGAYVLPILPPLVGLPFSAFTGRSATSVLALVVLAAVLEIAVLMVAVFSAELALRPLLMDVAAMLPAGFEPNVAGWHLRTKALAPFPFITLYSTLTVGAFVDLVARGPLRLTFALAIAVATVAVASVIFWAITRVLLDPIDELLAATERVGAGDVTTPVPVVTADELGALAQGFNRMLVRLRRHEQDAAAAERERRRLERDIHDGAQQRLAAIAMWLDGLENHLAGGNHDAAGAIARRASQELREAIEDLRRLSHGMPPPILTQQGLDAALRQLTARTPGASIRGRVAEPVAPPVGVAAYFAVAEGLANALRHSEAVQIEVAIGQAGGWLRVDVRDDGCGGARLDAGSGLRGLASRLQALDGRLEIDSPPGRGTELRIELPLHADRRGPRSP